MKTSSTNEYYAVFKQSLPARLAYQLAFKVHDSETTARATMRRFFRVNPQHDVWGTPRQQWQRAWVFMRNAI